MNLKQKIVLANASLWKRIVAFIIDMFIINTFLLMPFKKLFKKIPSSFNFSETYSYLAYNTELKSFIFKITLFASLIVFIYFILFETILNQTLGKMIFNIYVIPRFSNENEVIQKGVKISFFKSMIRNLFIFPFLPFIILWIVEPIIMFSSPLHQRLSEKLTQTRTVERFVKYN